MVCINMISVIQLGYRYESVSPGDEDGANGDTQRRLDWMIHNDRNQDTFQQTDRCYI